MKFRQFCAIKEAFGKNQGDTVNWLKVSNASAYGGTVAETATIPETTLPLALGTVSIAEYGLAIPFTFRLEALSQFDINQLVKGALLDDNVKVIDGVVEREFNKTPNVYCGTSTSTGTFYTASSCTETNTSVLNTYHINRMAAYLRDANVPGFPGLNGDYVFICAPNQMQELKNAMTGIQQYTELGYKYIANGEVGRFNGIRFVEENFATKYVFSAADRTATAISWTKGQSGPGYMFGSPTVREAVALPEEIRIKNPTDYGRSKGIAWYGMFGWAIEWDSTANARIVKWESKA